MKNILLLCFLPLLAVAQQSNPKFHSRFSVEIGAGKVNSFMYLPQPVYFTCFAGDPFIPVTIGDEFVYDEPTLTSTASFLLNFQISKRHQIGIGSVYSEQGYHRTVTSKEMAPISETFVRDYQGYRLRHRYDFVQGKHFKLGVANSIQRERLKDYDSSEYYGDKSMGYRRGGLSHIGEIVLGYTIGRHLEIDLNLMGKTALTDYNYVAFNKAFNRFGTGVMMSASFKL
ncbi:MAG: hypothetical protein IT258_01305 [Saprospiraceae bacterium]|nr:hypothetical protein [Saprospiraceae bacterium]